MSNPILNITLIAAADLSAKQYYAVKVDSAGKGALAGAGERAAGILQNVPESGKSGTVMVFGISKAVYGATVAAGAALMVNASGQLITATAGNFIVGTALEAGAVNEVHNVLLQPNALET